LLKKLGEWIPQLKSRVAPSAAEKPSGTKEKNNNSTKKNKPTTKPKKKK
jgi:hypothetical protein